MVYKPIYIYKPILYITSCMSKYKIWHDDFRSCLLTIFQYWPISFQTIWLSVEQHIRLSLRVLIHKKIIPILTCPIKFRISIPQAILQYHRLDTSYDRGIQTNWQKIWKRLPMLCSDKLAMNYVLYLRGHTTSISKSPLALKQTCGAASKMVKLFCRCSSSSNIAATLPHL